MRAIYLFPALLGACLVLLGSSVSLQAQDVATPPDSTEAPIDPIDLIDEQPPQGPNNPPQPPPQICGIEAAYITMYLNRTSNLLLIARNCLIHRNFEI
jgi:hypothetical protein